MTLQSPLFHVNSVIQKDNEAPGPAKIVNLKIGEYPYLPLVTNETTGWATRPWAYFVEDTDGTPFVNTSAITAWDDTITADAPVFSSSPLTCSAGSDDEECGDTMQVVNTTQWTDDSVYPSDYIAQYNSWIAAITANGGPPAYEPETLVDPDPGDVSLQCYSDIPSAEYTGTVEVNSALAAIGSQCALWQEQSAFLNWTDYRNTEAMASNSTGGNLWLGGFWNMGDPSCTNGLRAMENAECIYMMTAILNQCDVGSTNKQGGYMINNCIVWAMAVYE